MNIQTRPAPFSVLLATIIDKALLRRRVGVRVFIRRPSTHSIENVKYWRETILKTRIARTIIGKSVDSHSGGALSERGTAGLVCGRFILFGDSR